MFRTFAVLVFLVPIPGTIRQAIAIPLMDISARATEGVLDMFGIVTERAGNVLSINGVEVTQDLKEAKVWVGVLGGKPAPVLKRLNAQHGVIQNRVMKRVVLKSTPVLQFRGDSSVERGVDVVRLLEEVDELPKAPPEEEDELPKAPPEED